jgi:hypothetical protein
MKKVLSLAILFLFMNKLCHATTNEIKVNKYYLQEKIDQQKAINFSTEKIIENRNGFSRMTCTVYYTASNGTVYSATASSGWLLSNDANSLEKACEKATAALYQMMAPLA